MEISSTKQIKFGAILSYFSIILNLVAGLLYTPWMIEQIGQSDYGLYTLTNSMISLFMVDFGLGTATARYVAKYRAEGKQGKINALLGIIYKLYLAIDILIFVVLAVGYFYLEMIYGNFSQTEIERLKTVYIITASFAVVNFPFVTLNGILSAYEKFVQLKLADVIYRVLQVLLTIIALLCGFGLYALVLVHAFVGLLVIVFKCIVVGHSTPIKIDFSVADRRLYKSIFMFSAWVTVSTIAQRMLMGITPSILGVTANASAIAVFGVVATIEGYAYTFTNAINSFYLPTISKISVEEKKKEKLNEIILTVGKFQFVLNGLIVAGFTLIGKDFIQLWVGSDYLDAYSGILLLLISGLGYNVIQAAHVALTVEKRVDLIAVMDVIVGAINITLSLFFSKWWGVTGACLSIAIAYTLRLIIFLLLCHKILGIDIRRLLWDCYLRFSVPLITTIALGKYLILMDCCNSWFKLGCSVGIIAVIYGLLVWWFGLNSAEKKKVRVFIAN